MIPEDSEDEQIGCSRLLPALLLGEYEEERRGMEPEVGPLCPSLLTLKAGDETWLSSLIPLNLHNITKVSAEQEAERNGGRIVESKSLSSEPLGSAKPSFLKVASSPKLLAPSEGQVVKCNINLLRSFHISQTTPGRVVCTFGGLNENGSPRLTGSGIILKD